MYSWERDGVFLQPVKPKSGCGWQLDKDRVCVPARVSFRLVSYRSAAPQMGCKYKIARITDAPCTLRNPLRTAFSTMQAYLRPSGASVVLFLLPPSGCHTGDSHLLRPYVFPVLSGVSSQPANLVYHTPIDSRGLLRTAQGCEHCAWRRVGARG